MNKEIIIPVEEETMNLIEALHFDFNSYMNIIKTILTKNDISKQEKYEYNEDIYRIFMNEYREIYAQYESTKRQILEEYVPEEYKNLVFTFNFEKNVLEGSLEEGKCHVCK